MGALAMLLPLALQLAPGLARYLGGSDAGTTAGQVADAIRAVTGTDDPAAAATAIRDPAVAAQLQIRLAEIQAAREAADRTAELDTLRALLSDKSSARGLLSSMVQAGSAVQWAPVFVSLLVLATFGVVMFAALTSALPPGSETILNMLLGTLAAMATSVVGYWVGSSAGSAQKTELLARGR